MSPHPRVRVWDRFVRLFHWGLVLSFFTAWLSTEFIHTVHTWAGSLALALVVARVGWGLVSPNPYARFRQFVPGPRRLLAYLGALLRGKEPHHLGHNPAGAVMILFLMAAVITIGTTGWLMDTDAFWGNETVETLHTTTVDLVLIAVVVHVLANLYGTWHHHDNLIGAMFSGRKTLRPGLPPADLHPDAVIEDPPEDFSPTQAMHPTPPAEAGVARRAPSA